MPIQIEVSYKPMHLLSCQIQYVCKQACMYVSMSSIKVHLYTVVQSKQRLKEYLSMMQLMMSITGTTEFI